MTNSPTVLPDRVDSLETEGVVALVTGATSGIGLETARQLLRRGLTVWIGARDVARGRAVTAELSGDARCCTWT